MNKNNKIIKVIVADVCYDDNGLSTPVIPLGPGLVAAHAKAVNPEKTKPIKIRIFLLNDSYACKSLPFSKTLKIGEKKLLNLCFI